jgi:WD40 repeat protein
MSQEGRVAFSIGSKVVASASDGTFVIKTVDGYVAYVDGKPLRAIAADLDIADGNALSISPNGRWLAHVERRGPVSLWDLASGTRLWRINSGPSPSKQSFEWMTAPHSQALLSTGYAAFVGIGTIVTQHAGAIIAWDIASGEQRCAVPDRGMGMVRVTKDLGDDLIAASSSSFANPAIENRLWIIASLREHRTLDRFLSWPDDPIGAARHEARTYLASNDRVRLIDGDQHSILSLGQFASSFALAPDGSRLFFTNDHFEVLVWNAISHRFVTLRASQIPRTTTDSTRQRFVRVWSREDHVFALSSDGTVVSWPVPPAEEGTVVSPRLLEAIERGWENAIVEAAVGDQSKAYELLRPFEDGDGGMQYRAPAAYLRAVLTNEDPSRFRTRTRDAGIDFSDARVLEIAHTFTDHQLTGWGADILLYHFRDRGIGLPSAVETACELVRQLGEIDEIELQDMLIERLEELYPDSEEVNALIDQTREFDSY